jgi:hypothetical protein
MISGLIGLLSAQEILRLTAMMGPQDVISSRNIKITEKVGSSQRVISLIY